MEELPIRGPQISMKCAIIFEINVSLYSFVQKNDLILVYLHVADIC